MKIIVEIILGIYTRLTLLINNPRIIGITGSVGKTTTKDAVALVLSQKYKVGATFGNLNSQIGLPLSVLGFSKRPGTKLNLSNILGWLGIIFLGFFKIFRFKFPEFLVLEMGMAKPGDLRKLLSLIGELEVAVITDVGVAHMEFFEDEIALTAEKFSILEGLKSHGVAVLNLDSLKIRSNLRRVKHKLVSFGYENADITPESLSQNFMSQASGKPMVYAALAAVAVGTTLGLSKDEINQSLQNFKQPSGRLQLVEGINNSTIIDDTYNASPASATAAIDVLVKQGSGRKLIALGQMEELGSMSDEGHSEVGRKILETNLNLVFLVGPKTKVIQNVLGSGGFMGQIFWFPEALSAVDTVKNNLGSSDTILVKGSRAMKMEEIVKALKK